MLKYISNQTKILIPILLLSVILLFIASLIIKPNFDHMNQLKSLKERVCYSNNATSLLLSLQKERGLSYAYTVSHNSEFKKLLDKQINITDINIKQLKALSYKLKDKKLTSEIKNSLLMLQELKKVRTLILDNQISKEDSLKLYQQINQSIFASIKVIISDSNVPQITNNMISLISFLYIEDNLGLLRAKGSTILLKQSYTDKEILDYYAIYKVVLEYEKNFLDFSKEKIINQYKILKQSKDFQDYLNYNHQILSNQIHLSPIKWFGTLSHIIYKMNNINNTIRLDTENIINNKIQNMKSTFLLVLNLTILSLITFLLMIIAFLKLARNEQKLREVSDKYIISSMTDTKGRIIDVSQAFCKISGYTKDELIGKPHNIVRHPDMPKEVFKEMWQKIKQGKTWSGKVKNKTKDGGYYWVYANIEPLYNNKGKINSFISIRLDITENEKLAQKVKEEEAKNKKTQVLMQQQSRLAQMGEMISMIAHQWRQPLAAITATTSTLEVKAKLNKLSTNDIEESTKKIKNFAMHLSATIDDFRNFFKTNKTKTSTNFEQLIKSVKSIIDSTLSHNNIELEVITKSIEEIYTYEGELKQVILNLIKNAEDALIENGIQNPKITITIDGNKLYVHDNGGGIPEDIIDKIFNPYFSTKINKDGTGLGLYMSKTIVEEHCKGKIEVYNEDNGATFMITIPNLEDTIKA